MKRLLALITTVCVAVAFSFAINLSPVNAGGDSASEINYAKKITIPVMKNTNFNYWVFKDMYNYDNVKLKSSKKSVVEIYYDMMVPKKPGKAKITITYKKNGKTKKRTCTVKVVKYKNPFKKVKIGNVNYKSKFNNSLITPLKPIKKGTLKYDIKVKSGWKIKKVYLYSMEPFYEKRIPRKGSIKISKNNTELSFVIYVYNKKTKITQMYNTD